MQGVTQLPLNGASGWEDAVRAAARFGFGLFERRVTPADLTAAALDQTITFDMLPLGAIVIAVWVDLIVEFSGSGATAVNVDVGHDLEGRQYLKDVDVFTGPVPSRLRKPPGDLFDGSVTPADEGKRTLQLKVISDVAVNMLTTGDLVVRIACLVIR